jgi:hypothetical protein
MSWHLLSIRAFSPSGGSVPIEVMKAIKKEGSGVATKDAFKYTV